VPADRAVALARALDEDPGHHAPALRRLARELPRCDLASVADAAARVLEQHGALGAVDRVDRAAPPEHDPAQRGGDLREERRAGARRRVHHDEMEVF
jgi:hypothetical protein